MKGVDVLFSISILNRLWTYDRKKFPSSGIFFCVKKQSMRKEPKRKSLILGRTKL
jgi:hypothetical protein